MSVKLVACIHCYRFQRRLWWSLSSMVDQLWNDDLKHDEFLVRIHVSEADPFKDWSERLIKTFSPLLNLDVTRWDKNCIDFGCRALTRNDDIAKSDADWIVFLDADCVYDRTFFPSCVKRALDLNIGHYMMATWRYTMPVESADELVSSAKYDGPIRLSQTKIEGVPNVEMSGAMMGRGVCGAGFFQFADLRILKRDGRTYAKNWWRDQNVMTAKNKFIHRTDRFFRGECHGVVHRPSLPPLWHLNHDRQYRKDIALPY